MPYVYSTATNDTVYAQYAEQQQGGGARHIVRRVVVKGGANRATNDRRLITPQGVGTLISDDDAEFLKNDPAFQRHASKGFVKLTNGPADEERANSEKTVAKVVADMEKKDGAAPKTDADYMPGKAPKVSAKA